MSGEVEYREPDASYGDGETRAANTMWCNVCGSAVWTGDDGWACDHDTAMFPYAAPAAEPRRSPRPTGNPARDDFVLRPGSLRRLRSGSCRLRYRRHASHMTWVWCTCGWRADSIEKLVFRREIVDRWRGHLPPAVQPPDNEGMTSR